MDISGLKRNPDRVHSALKEVGDSLIAQTECRVYVPEHYMGTELGSMGNTIHMLGVFAIVVDGVYAVSKALSMVETTPASLNVVTIDGDKYMEFYYAPGDVVIANLNLVKITTLVFRAYSEFYAKGKVPWYLDYNDLCFLFDTSVLHGGANLGVPSSVIEMIAGSITRDSKDRMVHYRHTDQSADPTFIPLRSVAYGATNTTSKLLGAYFAEGVTSALVTQSTRNEPIEDLLRK